MAEGEKDDVLKKNNSQPVLADIKSSIEKIEENINIIKSKHVDVSKISRRLENVKLYFLKLSQDTLKADLNLKASMLKLEVKNLLKDSESKVAAHKRFNVISIVMLIFGFVIVSILIMFYVIFISRDK
ncbi:hypothetical protein ACFL20_13005 [Spirochaetota bacterium]